MEGHVEGGHKLRELRHRRELSQRDVERMTGDIVPSQQVSRIEAGVIREPTMRDLVALGQVYGLSPNQVAALYGYWTPMQEPSGEPGDVASQLRNLLLTLPPREQEVLASRVEFAMQLAKRDVDRAREEKP